MAMEKYYIVAEVDGRNCRPQNINLYRHSCDVYIKIVDDKVVSGFVFCKYNVAKFDASIFQKEFDAGKLKGFEIPASEYKEAQIENITR